MLYQKETQITYINDLIILEFQFQEMQEKIEDLMEPVLEEAREVAKETKEREKHKNNDID